MDRIAAQEIEMGENAGQFKVRMYFWGPLAHPQPSNFVLRYTIPQSQFRNKPIENPNQFQTMITRLYERPKGALVIRPTAPFPLIVKLSVESLWICSPILPSSWTSAIKKTSVRGNYSDLPARNRNQVLYDLLLKNKNIPSRAHRWIRWA